MPAPAPDFHEVMSDLVKFQFEIGKIHAQLTSPRQKEVLGEALAKIEQARTDALVAYPKALETIRTSALESKAQAAATTAKLDALKQRFAAMQAQAGSLNLGAAAQPAAPKFQGHAAQRLGSELLQRVKTAQPAADLSRREDKEIWQDWSKS